MTNYLRALLLLLAALTHDAQATVRITTADGSTTERELPSSASDRVIIELREPPLLARSARRIRTDAAALESLQARLATDLQRIQKSMRVEHRYTLAFAGASVRVDRDALPAIRALSYVKAIHPDRRVRATVETTVPLIGAPEAWARFGTRGRGVTVAVIDTGIDYRHPALGGGFGPTHKVIGGYDFVNNIADPMDDHGHGTHVAGIVAGNAAPVVGVAPEAALLAYKVLDADGYGYDSGILAAIERLLDPDGNGDPSDRADVVNMSLGRFGANDDPVVNAVEQATAAGVVFCIAAGNAGGRFSVASPGVAPSAITVGASDRVDKVASFSSRGPVLDSWGIKPEVMAPGVDVASAAPGNGMEVLSGTSMAAPHVAGLAALIRERRPDWTPADVKAAIVATAKPLRSVVATGAGRVDAVRAMEATLLPSPSTLTFGIVGAKSGVWNATRTFQLTNRGDAARSLTLRAEFPAGTTVSVSRPSLELLPGATADVEVQITVRVANAIQRDEGVALTGKVFVEDGASSVHVPWQVLAGNTIVAAYRGPGDVYVALFQNGNLLGEGSGAAGATSSGGTVDVFAMTSPIEGQLQRMIVRERLAVDGPTILDLAPEDAKHEIVIESVAETGERLLDLGRGSAGGVYWLHQFVELPSGVSLRFARQQASLLVSPLDETRIESLEQERHNAMVRTPDGLRDVTGVHFAALRSLAGVRQNETLSVGAGDWATATVEHPCATGCSVYQVQTMLGNQPILTSAVGSSRGDPDTDIALAGKTADGSLPGVILTVMENDHPPVSFTKGASVLSPLLVPKDGKIVAQAASNPWPLDYTPPAADAVLTYGYGPSILRTAMGIRWRDEEVTPPGDKLALELTPLGMIGQEYADDALRLRITMFDADGRRYDGVRVFADFYTLSEPMRDGPHRLEIVQSYRIGRARGTGTLTSTVDKATGAAAPTLTMLRIEDGDGRASFSLSQHEPARLVFAGRQSTFPFAASAVHTPIDSSATKVWWRPYPGVSEWRPLQVGSLGADYDSPDPIGSMFSVDLSAVTAAEGAGIALKFELASEQGTTSWTMEPAFFVGGTKRRRSM